MAITNLDQLIAAAKRDVTYFKSSHSVTGHTVNCAFDVTGDPGAGTLSPGNTANGIVPVAGTAGYPIIPNSGGDLYIYRATGGNVVSGRTIFYDRLWVAGAYAFNADVSLSSQPSFASRLAESGVYSGLQLWIETVTAFTGTPSIQIDYLDQDGNAGDTGVISMGSALPSRRCFQMPFQAGDSGIRRVDRVRCTVATAGTFNVMILRPLFMFSFPVATIGYSYDIFGTGLVRIFPQTALYALHYSTGSSYGAIQTHIGIAEG